MPCPKVKKSIPLRWPTSGMLSWDLSSLLRPVSQMALRYLVSRRNLIPRYGIPQPAFHGWLV